MPSVRNHSMYPVFAEDVSATDFSDMLQLTQAQVVELRKSFATSSEVPELKRSNRVLLGLVIASGGCLFGGLAVAHPTVPGPMWFSVARALLAVGCVWGIWNVSRLEARAQLVLDSGRQLDPLSERPDWCTQLAEALASCPSAVAYKDAVLASGRELLVRDGLVLDALVNAKKTRAVDATRTQALERLMKVEATSASPA